MLDAEVATFSTENFATFCHVSLILVVVSASASVHVFLPVLNSTLKPFFWLYKPKSSSHLNIVFFYLQVLQINKVLLSLSFLNVHIFISPIAPIPFTF